ncbi:MAG: hypothetical protein ACKVVP_14425 [Chloroflexota bacterium]
MPGRLWRGFTLAVFISLFLNNAVALAQDQRADITYLGRDETQTLDRYQFVIRPGSRMWDVAVNALPLVGFEESDQKAFDMVEQSYKKRFPERGVAGMRPGDTFTLEVAAGTFVTKEITRKPDSFEYLSFAGDLLYYYPNEPSVVYRLIRKEQSNRAELLLTGVSADPLVVARRIYGIDSPDFIQLRAIRAAINDRQARVTVDLARPYLDEFRNFRERAERIEEGETGLKAYIFPNDPEIPFVRVDDAIGTETDPGKFPRFFRAMYYRDGTIKRYFITESGDSVAALGKPLSEEWTRVLPSFQEWQPGQAESLPPFTSAVTAAGQILPGRIAVISHRPKAEQARGVAQSRGVGGATDCFGIPLLLMGVAGAVIRMSRGVLF